MSRKPPPGATPATDGATGSDLATLGSRALIVGGAASLVSIGGGLANPSQFMRSYLVAFIFWLSVALGCFALMTLNHLANGEWGLPIRRILEAAARTLPVLALLFLPIALGARSLYHWARPEEVAADPLLQHQAAYLNLPFFGARAAFYFALWIAFAWPLVRMSQRQDAGDNPLLARRMQIVAAPALALYCLTATFASIDWLMSLESHWHSTIYGFLFVIGQAVSAMSFVILAALFLAARRPMSEVFRPVHFHDYGKLLLTFVVLWAYLNVSQLIIIWQGNLPKEVAWYQPRMQGGWRGVSLLLIALHFALPFALLLSRDLKRNAARLAMVAGLLLAVRWLDLYWLAAPAFYPEGPVLHWLDAALPVALGGLWIGWFARELQRRPLLPIGDPLLPEAWRG